MRYLHLKFKSKRFSLWSNVRNPKGVDTTDIREIFAKEILPAYEADDGPLTAGDIDRICKAAEPILQMGNVINTQSLF